MYLDCLGTISSAYEYSQLQVIRNIPTGETPQYFDAQIISRYLTLTPGRRNGLNIFSFIYVGTFYARDKPFQSTLLLSYWYKSLYSMLLYKSSAKTFPHRLELSNRANAPTLNPRNALSSHHHTRLRSYTHNHILTQDTRLGLPKYQQYCPASITDRYRTLIAYCGRRNAIHLALNRLCKLEIGLFSLGLWDNLS